MGAAHSSAAASLQAHEPLLARLAGTAPIDDADDAFWAALLTTVGVGVGVGSNVASAALAAMPPADVEAALAPAARGLLKHNASTRNWQRLAARFGPLVADRAAEAMAALRAEDDGKASAAAAESAADAAARHAAHARDALAAANAMHLVAVLLKLVAEAPEDQGGGSAGLARLFVGPSSSPQSSSSLASTFCAQVAALLAHAPACPLEPPPGAPAAAASGVAAARRRWSEACYLPLLEATRLALALTAGQLATAPSPSSPAGSHTLLEALFEALGKGAPGAGALASQLLRVAVARPQPPAGCRPHAPAHAGAGLSLSGGAAPAAPGARSAVARVFWGVKRAAAAAVAGEGDNKSPEGAAALPDGAISTIISTNTTITTLSSSNLPDEAGAAGCGGPLGDGALLLLLLLLHFPAHHAGLGENCVRQAIYDLEDEDEDEIQEDVAAAHTEKKQTNNNNNKTSGPPPVPAAAPPPAPPPQPLAMSATAGAATAVAAAPLIAPPPLPPIKVKGSAGGGKKFALRLPFSALLAHFSRGGGASGGGVGGGGAAAATDDETEAGTLLLYSLLHGNRAFRERALACSADERAALLLPLLRALYGATTAPPTAGAAAAAARVAKAGGVPFFASSPNHLYMLQIVLLILSQDQAFAADVHSRRAGGRAGPVLPASAVAWYRERRLAAGGGGGGKAHHAPPQAAKDTDATLTTTTTTMGVTLGSLLFAVLLRSAAHSFGAAALAQDLYLPTNTLAALANLAPHARGLHPHAAQRLVGLAASLGKRYLRARRALELRAKRREAAVVSAGGGGGDGTAAAETAATSNGSSSSNGGLTEEQVNVLGDFLRIVLEVVNAVLAAPPAAGGNGGSDLGGASGNPELVYAVMHRREALAELREGCPRVSELADNALRAADFFSARLAEAVARSQGLPDAAAAAAALAPHDQPLPPEWGHERVLEAIAAAAPRWSPERAGMRALPELRFVYEEEAQAEDFFVPYGVAVALAGASAGGLLTFDLSRARLLVLQQQMHQSAQQQAQQQAQDEASAAREAAAASAMAASAVAARGRAAVSTLAPAISGALSFEDSASSLSLGGGVTHANGAASSFPSLPTLHEEGGEGGAHHPHHPHHPQAVAPAGGGWFGRWFW
jgi:hypothetical protein